MARDAGRFQGKAWLGRNLRSIALRGIALIGAAGLATQPVSAATTCMRGINLAGAEFGKVGDVYGKGYTYPSAETIRYFASKGFTAVRLPFLWERLQPKLYASFDRAEAKRLAATVELVRKAGMVVILDPHNYARYKGDLIGTDNVPQSAFADFWRRLSVRFGTEADIAFGLMNEPHGIAAEDWVSAANGAIAAIRQAGSASLILVPGTAWTGAHSWSAGDYGTTNAAAMSAIVDPQNNYVFEVHQYLDQDFSGKNDECSRAADAVKALSDVGTWLKQNNRRGLLGEFAVPRQPECQSALVDMVKVVESNPDAWLGWAYWAAGDWWPEDEILNIQPVRTVDKPQMATLLKAMSENASCGR